MTEETWLHQNDIQYLLNFFKGKASRRNLRLYTVACARRILHLLPDERCRIAIDVAESYADSRTTLDELIGINISLARAGAKAWRDSSRVEDNGKVYFATREEALIGNSLNLAHAITKAELDEVNASAAIDALTGVLMHSAISPKQWGQAAGDQAALVALESERRMLLHLFRDIFGNSFHPITIDPYWFTPYVTALAQRIYDDRTFNQMPILADELVKSGCANQEILDHCRGPGPHVRGCWVVDGVLGRE